MRNPTSVLHAYLYNLYLYLPGWLPFFFLPHFPPIFFSSYTYIYPLFILYWLESVQTDVFEKAVIRWRSINNAANRRVAVS
jgi:hypothetical protein